MGKQDKQSSLRVLLDILSFLIVGVLAIFYNIITTSVDGFLKQTFGEGNYLSKVLVAAFILIIILWRIQNYLKSKPDEATTESLADLRRQLLENLKTHYEGRIKAKMQGQLRFEIKLKLRYTLTGTSPAGVEDYFVIREEADAGDFDRLFETYMQRIRRLLILGEPGAGKSVLLLRFGLKLIEMAEKDPALPVPVILDLASWKGRDATFGDWLEANLPYISGTFGISKDYAKVLRDQNLVLPLLDGFDEIREQERDGCFEKLRTYLEQVRNSRAQVYPEVVVCSRIWEYEMAVDAPMAAAVMIQPLTKEDIQNTLRPLIAENDTPAKHLQKSLAENPALLAATNSAFLLHTLLDLQTDVPILKIQGTKPEAVRDEIIEMYIQAELKKIKKYPSEKAQKWLGWLAWKMKYRDGLVTFELTDLQPWWAKKKFTFGLVVALVYGLVGGLVSDSSFPKVENPYRRLTAQFWWDMGQLILILSLSVGLGSYFADKGNLSGFYLGSLLGMIMAIFASPVYLHFCLRMVLWLEGVIPPRLVSFLDSASFYQKDEKKNEVGLLLKDGGQWRFRHQLILDHLADWFEVHYPHLLCEEDLKKKNAEQNSSQEGEGGGKSES